MNQQQRRKRAKQISKTRSNKFAAIDLSKRDHPDWMTRAFANNTYVVMINDKRETDKGVGICAMIQRHDNKPLKNHWRTIQRIKNEIFGKEKIGIEYYPKESQVIDEQNIYWLWIFDEGVLPIPVI